MGILADHNTLLAEGVFVDFFGIPNMYHCGASQVRATHRRRCGPGVSSLGLGNPQISALL